MRSSKKNSVFLLAVFRTKEEDTDMLLAYMTAENLGSYILMH